MHSLPPSSSIRRRSSSVKVKIRVCSVTMQLIQTSLVRSGGINWYRTDLRRVMRSSTGLTSSLELMLNYLQIWVISATGHSLSAVRIKEELFLVLVKQKLKGWQLNIKICLNQLMRKWKTRTKRWKTCSSVTGYSLWCASLNAATFSCSKPSSGKCTKMTGRHATKWFISQSI